MRVLDSGILGALALWLATGSGLSAAPARPCAASALAFARSSDRAHPRLGGCETTRREYGWPPARDSLALAALEELLVPGPASRTGPACRRLGVEAPLFVTIGAVDPPPDSLWASLARQVSAALDGARVRTAERTLLGHTTGPCFPPYHLDIRACGDSAAVGAFLKALPGAAWQGFAVAGEAREREFLLTAGTSLQSPSVTLGLRRGAARPDQERPPGAE